MEFGEVIMTRHIEHCQISDSGKSKKSKVMTFGSRKGPDGNKYQALINIGTFDLSQQSPQEVTQQVLAATLVIAQEIRRQAPHLAAEFDKQLAAGRMKANSGIQIVSSLTNIGLR